MGIERDPEAERWVPTEPTETPAERTHQGEGTAAPPPPQIYPASNLAKDH